MYIALLTIVLSQSPSVQFAELLDIDGDGVIHPMEAADALQMLLKETDQVALQIEKVDAFVDDYQLFLREEASLFIEDIDENGDGVLELSELPEDLVPLAKYSDLDNDGIITVEELLQVDPDSDDVFALVEIDEIFVDLDGDGDGLIAMEVFVEDDEEFAELIAPFDLNRDNIISRDELIAGFAILDAPVTFEIDGTNAIMSGTIGQSTPFRVMELVLFHPEVKTIVMTDVPGSVDDDSSLRASRMVRAHGLNTHVPSDGEVASGGTDFFQAGVQRTCEKGAMFGIHSWAEFGAEGSDYPRESEEHDMYLDYCDEMGIPQSFYWYTLEVASADDIHWMTEKELAEYEMLTSPIVSE